MKQQEGRARSVVGCRQPIWGEERRGKNTFKLPPCGPGTAKLFGFQIRRKKISEGGVAKKHATQSKEGVPLKKEGGWEKICSRSYSNRGVRQITRRTKQASYGNPRVITQEGKGGGGRNRQKAWGKAL